MDDEEIFDDEEYIEDVDVEDEPEIEEIYDDEYETVLDNPSGTLEQAKSVMGRITLRRMVFSGLGLATPVIVPRLITRITGYSIPFGGNVASILVAFIIVVLGSMLIDNVGTRDDAEWFMAGGIAGISVNVFSMVADWVSQKVLIPESVSTPAISGARHELYVPETRAIGNDVVGELTGISREVIAPTFEGIENIGNGVYASI